MIKVLIWQVLNNRNYLDSALKTLERQHNGIELVGVTADVETSLVYEGKNVTFIPLDKLTGGGGYDLILVIGAKQIGMSSVIKDADQFNLPVEKLLGDWIVCIPGFTLDKYRELQRSRLSIISKNCFGGLISHTLGLPLRSPFVNMDVQMPYFLKFLSAPNHYIEQEPKFDGFVADSVPLISLDDIKIVMVHYKEVDDAIEKWNKRKQRINWNNLLVAMYTDNKEILAQFDELPYKKKICFVSFKSNLDSAFYLNQKLYNKPVPSPKRITEFMTNDFARGNSLFYNPFDMLLYGKKTPLIDMD